MTPFGEANLGVQKTLPQPWIDGALGQIVGCVDPSATLNVNYATDTVNFYNWAADNRNGCANGFHVYRF